MRKFAAQEHSTLQHCGISSLRAVSVHYACSIGDFHTHSYSNDWGLATLKFVLTEISVVMQASINAVS